MPTHVQIREITVADAGLVEQVVGLMNAATRLDSPWTHPSTVATVTGMMEHGWDGEPPRSFVALEEGRVVGSSEIWASDWDNRDLAWLDLTVHPDRRRAGIGSAMVEHLFHECRTAGRTKVGVDAWDSPVAHAFAERHGLEKKAQAVNRRQVLATVDPGVIEKLYVDAAAAAEGYELVRILGHTPEDIMDRVAVMVAAINDAPLDDLDMEDEVFPPDRVRAYEDAALATGNRLYRLVARHVGTGELAGHTVVKVESARPAIGHQDDTSVVRAHRGHRLGLLLKAGMVRWLLEAEPELESVDTWNAESNDHMIAVNEQLGYQVLGRGLSFQRQL